MPIDNDMGTSFMMNYDTNPKELSGDEMYVKQYIKILAWSLKHFNSCSGVKRQEKHENLVENAWTEYVINKIVLWSGFLPC